MKKYFLLLVMCGLLTACGGGNATNSTTQVTETTGAVSEKETEPEVLGDKEFIENLGKGLEARWTITEAEDDEGGWNSKQHTTSEVKEHAYEVVNSEIKAIGNIGEYNFENEEIKELANDYYEALLLQYDAIDSFTADTAYTGEKWNMGYWRRIIDLEKFFGKYGATVDEKFQSNVIDMSDTKVAYAKKYVGIQNWLNNLSIDFQIDEEDSAGDWKEYKGLIENTSGYEIDSLSIYIDLLDENGVVIKQESAYLNKLVPDNKYYAEFMSDAKFKDIRCTYEAYWE